jgi:hypothetical protein
MELWGSPAPQERTPGAGHTIRITSLRHLSWQGTQQTWEHSSSDRQNSTLEYFTSFGPICNRSQHAASQVRDDVGSALLPPPRCSGTGDPRWEQPQNGCSAAVTSGNGPGLQENMQRLPGVMLNQT